MCVCVCVRTDVSLSLGSSHVGRRELIAVPGSLDHPENPPHARRPFPLLLSTRLSPSFPCESIVRSRGAPWLGLDTIRGGLLLVDARGLTEEIARMPEQRRRRPILANDNGIRRSTNPYVEGAFVSFSPFPDIPCFILGLHGNICSVNLSFMYTYMLCLTIFI